MKLFKPIFKHWSYLADFVVIVAGIIVALSLDAWWQNKQDRKIEKQYLEQLYIDFKATENAYFNMLDITQNRKTNLDNVIRIIQEKSPFESDSLDKWLREGMSSLPFTRNDGTFQALIQSGKISIISNDNLRTLLASYNGRIQLDIEKLMSDWNHLQSMTLQPFFMNELSSYHGLPKEYKTLNNLPLSNRWPMNYGALMNDSRFIQFVINLLLSKLNEVDYYERIFNHTKDIRILLEEELGFDPTGSIQTK